MCGRYSLTTAPEALRRLFEFDTTPNLEPRYNIAPSQSAPVVRLATTGAATGTAAETGAGTANGAARELAMPRWGLIPSWAKDASIGHKMINARSETVAEKPSFRSAFRHRRCLVPADGFYEWRTEGDIKQPFRIGMAGGGPFAFAGLWESWPGDGDDDGEAGGAIETFTILTTEANRKLHPIHPRMPVILAPEAYQTWLDGRPETTERALSLLRPFADEKMAFYRVSRRVNSPRYDDPACIEPIPDAG